MTQSDQLILDRAKLEELSISELKFLKNTHGERIDASTMEAIDAEIVRKSAHHRLSQPSDQWSTVKRKSPID